jgi:hypothetical protein
VRRQIGAEVLGVDLRPPERGVGEFPILKLNAVREVLPRADVAVCVCLVAQAVAGTGAEFRHSVAPLWIRQIADIRY